MDRANPDGSMTIHGGNGVRPAFAEGNLLGVRHGANTEKILSTRSADIAEALIGVWPWVLDCDVVAIEQYCRAEARTRLLNDWAMEMAETKGILAVPPHVWSEISKAETNAGRFAEALGLNPMGRMKIAKDAGFARHFEKERLSSLMAEGREMRRGA